jgi:ABC-2 type transport system permease protein
MNKIWLVLRQEIVNTLSRKSFLFAMFGIPIIGVVVFLIAGQLSKANPSQNILSQLISSPPSVQTEGYVDLSGIIKAMPANVPASVLEAFPNEASAMQAMDKGEISGYYIIPHDYLQTGEITYIPMNFSPLGSTGQSNTLDYVINYNLLGENTQLARLVNGPTVITHPLSTAPQREQSNPLTYFLPYGATMLFYIIILSAASLLLSSVAKEKENRVIEILMSSVTPRQLLTGKIVGLGLLGLLQTIVWVGTARILLAQGGAIFNLPIAFQLPASFLVWGVIFFVLGYAVYASLMAGLGALVPNLREATQATILVIFPLIIPIFLLSVLINEPNSVLSVVLSMFPFTAPIAMITRLSAGEVPLWQILVTIGLLIITTGLVIRAVARMFQAQTILSGQPFSRKLFIDTLFGRA